MIDLSRPRLTKKCNGCFGLIKVKDDEQEIESPYPNTLRAILECFNRLGELENAIEDGELVPVVHGEWVEDDTGVMHYCSRCHQYNGSTTYEPNYCPNCGAKMNLEGEQNESK